MTAGLSAAAPPAHTLIDIIRGYQWSQALYVAARLGIADLLATGPRDCTELAEATETHAPSLYRLLGALAGLGVFDEIEQGRFALAALGEPLRSDVPTSARAELLMWADPALQWAPWGGLLHSVRTGERAFDHLHGATFYDYLAGHPDDNAMFNRAMAGGQYHAQLPAAYDFAGVRRVVDVGGGNGRLLAAILRANPTVHGVLLDQPHVIARAAEVLRAAGVADRCTTVAGDYTVEIPADGDVYIFSNVLMDQDDAHAVAILRICRRAMAMDGRLLVVERIIPSGDTPSLAHMSDLMALAVTGGRIRSAAEFRPLFETAGFRLANVIDMPGGHTVLEGQIA